MRLARPMVHMREHQLRLHLTLLAKVSVCVTHFWDYGNAQQNAMLLQSSCILLHSVAASCPRESPSPLTVRNVNRPAKAFTHVHALRCR